VLEKMTGTISHTLRCEQGTIAVLGNDVRPNNQPIGLETPVKFTTEVHRDKKGITKYKIELQHIFSTDAIPD